ncbi:SDR family oxidoreductase [Candidatus Zixiibacteriota bacterium]
MSADLFLTGATGFIGRSLLQKWLDSTDTHIHLLVRGRREESPAERMEQVLIQTYPDRQIGALRSRFDIVEGDISLDQFGLNDENYRRLSERVSHIIHCAAAARFDLELDQARSINVRGTENILALAQECIRPPKIDYIGTAYVAGQRKGVIKEDELDEGQEHNNTYERSKLEAEKLVRDNMADLPITIFRPSIVIGDSKTGRVSGFSAFYRVLKMYLLGRLNKLPGDPSCPLDLVPVDYTTDVTHIISGDGQSRGRCYHLTAGLDNATTLEEIQDLTSHYFGREKFAIIAPEEFLTYISRVKDSLSEEEQAGIDELRIYLPYLTGQLRFDNSNTLDALSLTGLEVPRVSDYFGKMAEYMRQQM